MVYVKQNWSDGQSGGTPITAARLNHIEDGMVEIEVNSGIVDDTSVSALVANDTTATAAGVDARIGTKVATDAVNPATAIGAALTAQYAPGGTAGNIDTSTAESIVSTETTLVLSDPMSDARAALEDTLAAYADDAIGGVTPGTELAYMESATLATTVAVQPGATAVPGMWVAVTGTGRPVEVEFYVPSAFHSIANGGVAGVIIAQKAGGDIEYRQIAYSYSPATDKGPALVVKCRMLLGDGEEWTIVPHFAAVTAGTACVYAHAWSPMYISVIGR